MMVTESLIKLHLASMSVYRGRLILQPVLLHGWRLDQGAHLIKN